MSDVDRLLLVLFTLVVVLAGISLVPWRFARRWPWSHLVAVPPFAAYAAYEIILYSVAPETNIRAELVVLWPLLAGVAARTWQRANLAAGVKTPGVAIASCIFGVLGLALFATVLAPLAGVLLARRSAKRLREEPCARGERLTSFGMWASSVGLLLGLASWFFVLISLVMG